MIRSALASLQNAGAIKFVERHVTLHRLVFLLALTGLLISLDRYWTFDDDHANFFMTGEAVYNYGDVRGDLDRALALFDGGDFRWTGVEGIEARRDNLLNYMIPSAIYGLAPRLLGSLMPVTTQDELATLIPYASLLGYAICLIVTATILTLAVIRCSAESRKVAIVFLLTSIAILFINRESYYAEYSQDWFNQLYLALANPGVRYGPLGMTPRNNFVLLCVGLFLLRYEGRWRESYYLLLVAMLFHRQQGALVLLMVLTVDFLVRPRVFFDWKLVVAPALAIAYFVTMETFWQRIGIDRTVVVGAAIAVALGAYALAYLRTRRKAQSDGQGPRLGWIAADFVIIALLISALIALSFYVLESGRSSTEFFWTLLPARLIVIFHPLFLLFSIVLLLAAAKHMTHQKAVVVPRGGTFVALGLCAVIAVEALADVVAKIDPVTRNAYDFWGRVPAGLTPDLTFRDEELLYAAIIHDAYLEPGLLDPLLEATAIQRHLGPSSSITSPRCGPIWRSAAAPLSPNPNPSPCRRAFPVGYHQARPK